MSSGQIAKYEKFLPFPLLAAALSFVVLGPAFPNAAGGITVEVKKVDTTPKQKRDPKKKAAQTPAAESERNKLVITLRNTTREDYKGLQVNYYFFGHDAGESAVEILQKGTASADLAPGATATVNSEEATVDFTPAHTDKKSGRVKAIGKKMAGYGVQVMSGGNVIGEYFSSEAMRKALAPEPAKH